MASIHAIDTYSMSPYGDIPVIISASASALWQMLQCCSEHDWLWNILQKSELAAHRQSCILKVRLISKTGRMITSASRSMHGGSSPRFMRSSAALNAALAAGGYAQQGNDRHVHAKCSSWWGVYCSLSCSISCSRWLCLCCLEARSSSFNAHSLLSVAICLVEALCFSQC